MTDATKGGILVTSLLAVGIAVGLGIGWELWQPKPPKVETYAPQVRQRDGSLVLERKPMAPEDAAKVVPLPQLPKGVKVERQVQVVVRPNPPAEPVSPLPSGSGASTGDNLTPDHIGEPTELIHPVRVNLALVRMPDQTRRVIASSPDGEVVGGVDIPEAPAVQTKTLKWAAGGSWNPADKTWGGWVERDVAFVRVGADVFQQRDFNGRVTWAGMVRAGIRF